MRKQSLPHLIRAEVYAENGNRTQSIQDLRFAETQATTEWELIGVADIYSKQKIVKAGIIPEQLVLMNDAFLAEMQGLKVCAPQE